MLSPTALTCEQLLGFKARHLDDVDMLALLGEIKRLRAIVIRANQLQRGLRDLAGGPGVILKALRADLETEPCVAEQSLPPQRGNCAAGLAPAAIDIVHGDC